MNSRLLKSSLKKNLLLVVLSLCVTLVCIEVFLRMGGYSVVTFYPLSGFHQFDDELGYIQVPNYEATFQGREYKVTMKSNSQSFRDEEYPFEKPIGVKRVVILGDSFTWGWGVEHEEMYGEVAEKAMKGFEFINLGQTAYATAQEFLLFKRLGQKFSPDLTVLAFGPNDIMENISVGPRRPIYSLNEGELTLSKPPPPVTFSQNFKKTLKDYFLLYSLIDYRIALLKPIQSKPNGYWVPDYYLKSYQPKMEEAWKITQALILELNKLTQNKLLILYIPNRLQVEEQTYQQALLTTKFEESLIDLSYPNRILSEFAVKNEIPLLDLTTIFREESQKKQLYFIYDGHWTKEGHHLAGNLLRDKVEKLLFQAFASYKG